MRLRHADPQADAAACAAIYAPHCTDGVASFEEEAPTAETMAARIHAAGAQFAFLVAEDDDGRVLGFAYAAPHHTRPAYRWAVTTAIYVDEAARGRGVGRALYGALLDLVREQGVRTAIALVTVPNAGSEALHAAVGFRHAGTLTAVGFKHGAWRDVAYLQLELAPPAGAPAELRPPGRLPG